MYSPLLILFLTVFVDLIGFGIIIPLTPLYAETFGATGLEIGFLLTSYALARFIFSPMVGGLSDRMGRKKIMAATLFISGIAHLLFALSGSLLLLLIARVVAGLGASNISVAHAYIADSTDTTRRTQGMGFISAAFNLGFVLGPAIGGVLSIYGFTVPLLLASALSFSSAGLTMILLPESLPKDVRKTSNISLDFNLKQYVSVIPKYGIGLLLLMSFLVSLTVADLNIGLPLFGVHKLGLRPFDVGLLFTVSGMFGGVAQALIVGKLARKFPEARVFTGGTVIACLGLFLMVASYDLFTISAAVAFASLGMFIGYPLISSMISKITPPDVQGGIMGVKEGYGSLAMIIGPIIGGSVVDVIGVEAPLILGALTMLTAFIASLRLRASRSYKDI